MRIQMPFFLFALSAGASGWCVAADVVVQPSSGSGFVIKDAGGVNERLRVNENGQVSLPGVGGASVQTQALCIGAAGLLGPCSSGGYAAGAGLALTGTTFSVAPAFQLPQACAANQIAQWSGSVWVCGVPGGGVPGSGALNYVVKWTPDGASIGKSVLFDDGAQVAIGAKNPTNQLQIGNLGNLTQSPHILGFNHFHIAFGDGMAAGLFQGPSSLLFSSTTDIWLEPKQGQGGNVGINVGNAPISNRLQIGVLGSSGFNGNDIAFGNKQASGLYQGDTFMQFGSTTDMRLLPQNGLGHVGIDTSGVPKNRLEIGGIQSYNGNDIAFGNGAKQSGMAQLADRAQWASSTNIALMPQDGGGRVGINTAAPRAILDVVNLVPVTLGSFERYPLGGEIAYGPGNNVNVAIYADGDVTAFAFDAISDARIKNITGVSESAHDLKTLNAIEVTDYTMKDGIAYGNRPFKKVVAQQVEAVYPQVVSKHTDFIPNVYQSSDKIERVARGIEIGFDHAHHLSANAKRLKLLTAEGGVMRSYAIAAIPSEAEVIVDATDLHADRVFVYGEEVDDFRTVDYDGLTTLNISATQELAKRFARQEDEIAASMRAKDAQIAELQRAVAQLQTNAADIAELRATLAALRAAQSAHAVAVAVAQP